ncbi:sorbitol-6-phosphate dehydrogenase [Candidatus Hydrogenedentota bacterium]
MPEKCCRAGPLDGRVAVVTGGSQGLGEAICLRLAKEGVNVVIADINDEAATAVAEKIKTEYDMPAFAVKVDVTNEEEVEAAFQKAVEEFGTLDLAVCNAGILISGEITEFDRNAWQKVIDVNLVGYFLAARAAARIMAPKKSGVIIQINSKSGKKGSAKNSAYAASKFGGIGLTQSLALELAGHGIRVNSICPGNLLDSPLWVNSLFKQYAANQGITEEEVRQKYIDQVPLKRGCQYDDVTNLLVFLASDGASYMTGQAFNVTGGQEMK